MSTVVTGYKIHFKTVNLNKSTIRHFHGIWPIRSSTAFALIVGLTKTVKRCNEIIHNHKYIIHGLTSRVNY